MKPFSWLQAGAGILVLSGLLFLGMAWFASEGLDSSEGELGAGKTWLKEVQKRVEGTRSHAQTIHAQKEGLRLQKDGTHRVMVSRTLVFLPERKDEPVQALTKDSPIVTADGIQVAWKLLNEFDPADPSVALADPDGDGFTNREEFEAKTNPKDKASSPAKESKLRVRQGETVPMSVTFPEKSGGILTLRLQVGTKRAEFKGKVGDRCWILAGPGSVEIFTDEQKATVAQAKRKDSGGGWHLIPVKMSRYQEKIEMVKDASTGVDVEMDNSTLTLQREDSLAQEEVLSFGSSKKTRSLTWDVGEIRFFSPVEGVGEIGPFQVGQSFAYEGQKFSIQKREQGKVLLASQGSEVKEFWVPPETPGPHPIPPSAAP